MNQTTREMMQADKIRMLEIELKDWKDKHRELLKRLVDESTMRQDIKTLTAKVKWAEIGWQAQIKINSELKRECQVVSGMLRDAMKGEE